MRYFETMWTFCLQEHHTFTDCLASGDYSFWKELLLWHLLNSSILFPLSFSCIIRIQLLGRTFPSPSFIYTFNYFLIFIWVHIYLFYSMGCNAFLLSFNLLLQLSLICPQNCFFCPFDVVPSWLSLFLFSGTTQCSRLTLIFSLPQTWNQPLPHRAWFFFIEEWYLKTKI